MTSLLSKALSQSTKMLLICKPCSHQHHSKFGIETGHHIQQTFENIFNDENKSRAQQKLTVEIPVRTSKEYALKQGYKYAAVLVPLCTVHNDPSLLFTLRSSQLKKHRGQVSFPGGNVDGNDKDFTHTALRETHEELGISPSSFDVWGQMNPLPGSDGNRMVYPILARTGEVDVANLNFNHDEVDQAFCVSIQHLCDFRNIGSTRFCEGPGYTLPVYLGAAHRIWGLTAIIVHQVLNIVAPDLYKFKLKHKRSVHEKDRSRKDVKQTQSSQDS